MSGIVGEVCLTIVALAHIFANHRHRMKVADRERLVNPVKPPQPVQPEAVEAPIDLKTGRSAA